MILMGATAEDEGRFGGIISELIEDKLKLSTSAELEVLFSDAKETLDQVELD